MASQLSGGVVSVQSNAYAFAAIKSDGSVVAWGGPVRGGDTSSVAGDLQGGVRQVVGTTGAFAALKADGSVVTWGDANDGGDSSLVASDLSSGVVQVVAADHAFAAIKSDGSVVAWGDPYAGGDPSDAAENLTAGVVTVVANRNAFAAVKRDGSVITWGQGSSGGNSSVVAPPAASLASGIATVASPLYLPATAPGPPTDVIVPQATVGATQAVVSFSPPADDGGSPVTGYRVACTPVAGGATMSAGGSDPRGVPITGLAPLTAYRCSASAANVVGESAASAPSAIFTTAALPTPPPLPAEAPPSATPLAPVTPDTGAPPKLPVRFSCTQPRTCITTGIVPAGATRVVQFATQGTLSQRAKMREMAAPHRRIKGRCRIQRVGPSRSFTCTLRMGTGRWSVTTQALAGSRVISETVIGNPKRAPRPVPVAG